MTKSVILHVGSERTGSTALQFLATRYNRELRECGIFYPASNQAVKVASAKKDGVHFESGNALPIFEALSGIASDTGVGPSDLKIQLAALLTEGDKPDCDIVLLSSERLASLDELHFRYIKEALHLLWPSESVQIFPLLVVRDIVDQDVSRWAHRLRRHGVDIPREDSIGGLLFQRSVAVARALASVFGKENLLVIKYGNPVDILRIAFEKAGATISETVYRELRVGKVNPSLSLLALRILQGCLEIIPEDSWIPGFGGSPDSNELYTDIGDFLLTAQPSPVDRPLTDLLHFPTPVADEIRRHVEEKFGPAIEAFNSEFAPRGGPLRVASDAFPGVDHSTAQTAELQSEHLYQGVVREMATALLTFSQKYEALRARIQLARTMKDSGIFDQDYYLNEVREQREWPNLGRYLTPAMAAPHFIHLGWRYGLKPSHYFDPLWYRRKYPDLSNANPVKHYVYFGAREGRTPSPTIPSELAQRFSHAGNLVSLLSGKAAERLREELGTLDSTGREQ